MHNISVSHNRQVQATQNRQALISVPYPQGFIQQSPIKHVILDQALLYFIKSWTQHTCTSFPGPTGLISAPVRKILLTETPCTITSVASVGQPGHWFSLQKHLHSRGLLTDSPARRQNKTLKPKREHWNTERSYMGLRSVYLGLITEVLSQRGQVCHHSQH